MAQAVQRPPVLGKLTRIAHISPVTAFGIRYATAVSAAIWLGHAPGLVENQSKWILITVCVVMQPIAGGSLSKAILRSVGTLVAFFAAILVFGLFSQDPPLLLASVFLVLAVGAYGFTGPRHQYAWFVFAFMVAATPTRGGAFQSVFAVAAGLLLAWLLADLGIVYFAPHASRLPLGLLFAFAVAGTFAYVSASRPALEAVRKFGTLIALLSVYVGKAAPTDVQGSYDTMCFAALALGVGWASTRLLWPATASALFRARAADQLELCRRALVERDPSADSAERWQQAKAFLAAHTKQLAQLGSLHNQARHEPAEGSLDDARRAELLALTQDLFDAIFATLLALRRSAELLARGGDALAPLREALSRMDEALFASMQHAAATVRDGVAAPTPSLAEARDAVEERIAEVRARPELQPPLEDPETKAFLRLIAWRRRLVIRQLAIEQWLSGG